MMLYNCTCMHGKHGESESGREVCSVISSPPSPSAGMHYGRKRRIQRLHPPNSYAHFVCGGAFAHFIAVFECRCSAWLNWLLSFIVLQIVGLCVRARKEVSRCQIVLVSSQNIIAFLSRGRRKPSKQSESTSSGKCCRNISGEKNIFMKIQFDEAFCRYGKFH